MSTSAIAVHVEAAKRLLRELEQHGEVALTALGRESGSEFFAAVNARDQILGQLDGVVETLTTERQGTVAERCKGVGLVVRGNHTSRDDGARITRSIDHRDASGT